MIFWNHRQEACSLISRQCRLTFKSDFEMALQLAAPDDHWFASFPPFFTHNPPPGGYIFIHFGNVVVTHASWGMPTRNLAALIAVLLACSHSSILQLTSRTSSSQSNACSSRTEADVLWFVICLAKKRKERKMGCGSTFLYLTHSPLSQGFFSTD